MINKYIGQFIDSHVVGGAEVLIIELAEYLKGHAFVPIVMHFGNRWIAESCSQFKLPQAQIPHHELYKSIKTLPIFAYHFRRFLLRHKIDILHSHLVDPICAGTLATFGSRIKHIGTLHDTHTLAERPAKCLPLKASALTGTRLVTVSHEMADFMSSKGRVFQHRLPVIYNGIDLKKYQRIDMMAKRDDFGLAPDDLIAVCVGRLVPVKGHEVLIRSWAMLDASLRARLIIIGEGPLRMGLEQMVRELGLSDRICFWGLRRDVPDLLSIADIFVLSSHSEGLSCSILEAMAAGLPVVATAVGGNPELICDGVNGFLVPPADPAALSVRLTELIIRDDCRQTFGEASRRLVEKNFSVHHMVDQYIRLYREVLAA